MNWEAIGAIGEIVGAFAVIATLAYLAIQIRQNTRSTTTAIYESAMDGYVELNRAISEADIGEILFKSVADLESMSELELFRAKNLHRMWLAHVYKLFRLYERGILPEDEWKTTIMDAVNLTGEHKRLHLQFRPENPFFNDLYAEIDRYKASVLKQE